MSMWLWVNLSLGAMFVLAIVGVPLWLVIARPDTGPQSVSAAAWRRQTIRERAASQPAWRPARRHPAGAAPAASRQGAPRAAGRLVRPGLDQA